MKKTKKLNLHKQDGFKVLLLALAVIAVLLSVLVVNTSKISKEPKAGGTVFPVPKDCYEKYRKKYPSAKISDYFVSEPVCSYSNTNYYSAGFTYSFTPKMRTYNCCLPAKVIATDTGDKYCSTMLLVDENGEDIPSQNMRCKADCNSGSGTFTDLNNAYTTKMERVYVYQKNKAVRLSDTYCTTVKLESGSVKQLLTGHCCGAAPGFKGGKPIKPRGR